MKKIVIFLLISCIVCANEGCHKPTNTETAHQIFQPLDDTQEIENIDAYIDKIEIVEVNDDDKLYTADISKVLIDANENLYILDITGNFVVYDSNEMRLKRLINRGRAANEYIQIDDIALSDSEIMILGSPDIKCFDISDPRKCRIIRTPAKVPFDGLAPYKDGGVYLFSAFPAKYRDVKKEKDFLLYCVDSLGNILSEDILREDCTFSLGNISQSYDNTYYLRPQNNKHVYYQLALDEIIPKYQIDFGSYVIPDRYFFNEAKEDIRTYMNSDYFKLPIYLHETLSHVFFNAAGPNAEEYNFLYNKKNGQGIRWCSKKGDSIMHILASNKDYFYIILPGFTPEVNDNHGTLVKYIKNNLIQAKKDCNNMYIIKLKFKEL